MYHENAIQKKRNTSFQSHQKQNIFMPTTQLHKHKSDQRRRNTIFIIATLRFESITASAQHARNGGKTCSNTLQASAASPDAKNFPLPSNATEVTQFVWPLSSASC
jgi:hypothetical protein